jgi:hypothetical protein
MIVFITTGIIGPMNANRNPRTITSFVNGKKFSTVGEVWPSFMYNWKSIMGVLISLIVIIIL